MKLSQVLLGKFAARLKPEQRAVVQAQLEQKKPKTEAQRILSEENSPLELVFLRQLRTLHVLEPEREHAFALPERRWRLDFAWVLPQIAVEIEGGTRGKSRHTTHEGYTEDCEKYNAALELGWAVFRFTSEHVTSGKAAETMARVLEQGRGIL